MKILVIFSADVSGLPAGKQNHPSHYMCARLDHFMYVTKLCLVRSLALCM